MAEEAIPGVPAMMTGLSEMSKQGFYLGFAKQVTFNQISIENHDGPAFVLENTEQIEISGLHSTQSEDPEELIVKKQFSYETN